MGYFKVILVLYFYILPSLAFSSGPLMLVGGALSDDNRAIYEKYIELAGASRARIGIITAASHKNFIVNQRAYIDLFASFAVEAQQINININNPSAAYSNQILKQLDGLTGFFFGGGDQLLLKKLFTDADGKDSPLLNKIRDMHRRGVPVAGTSAGSAIMSGFPHVMITGGWPHKSMLKQATPHWKKSSSGALTYEPRGGFGFFPYGIIDTHFSERQRQGRLIRLSADSNSRFGFGIDENTALVLEKTSHDKPLLTVFGEGGVYIVDLLHAKVNYDSKGNWQVHNVTNHYLKKGDQFDPLSGSAFLRAKYKKTSIKLGTTESIDFGKGYPYQINRKISHNSLIAATGAMVNTKVSVGNRNTSDVNIPNRCSRVFSY